MITLMHRASRVGCPVSKIPKFLDPECLEIFNPEDMIHPNVSGSGFVSPKDQNLANLCFDRGSFYKNFGNSFNFHAYLYIPIIKLFLSQFFTSKKIFFCFHGGLVGFPFIMIDDFDTYFC